MTNQAFSLVIRGGTAVLPQGVARVDIGIRDETILAIGENLGRGANEIDAVGLIVAPGGVDPHAHIEQVSGGRAPQRGQLRKRNHIGSVALRMIGAARGWQ
jgi:dihydropyrimidinase